MKSQTAAVTVNTTKTKTSRKKGGTSVDSCLQVTAVRAPKPPEDGAMDANLWSNLPDFLVENILPRLPLASLFKFRAVCKTWNSLIQEQKFLATCYRKSTENSWFFLSAGENCSQGVTFDPSASKWYRIPMLFAGLLGHSSFTLCAGHGGLACFISKFDARGWMTLALCNPLLNTWRALPPMVEIVLLIAAGMVVDRHKNSYKVVVSGIHRAVDTAHEGPGRREVYRLLSTTQLYDSETGCWKESGAILPGNYRSVAISCNGNLYAWCYVADILVEFDITTEVWTQVQAQKLRSFQLCYKLVECEGRLMMIAGLRKNLSTTSICLLELVYSPAGAREMAEWVRVDRMPSLLCDQLLTYGNDVRCVGSNAMVLLYVVQRKQIKMLVLCDLSKRLWRRLTRPFLPDDKVIHGVAFEPRVDITM